MRRYILSIPCLLPLAVPASGSGKKWTEAENMGLAGPVQSAATTRQTFMQEPTQPGGPTLVYPMFCEYCEFDRNGTEVKGRTGGSLERKILDAQGWVEEDITEDEKGVVLESRSWSRFDAHGNEIESVSEGPGDIYYDVIQAYDPRTGELESFTSLNPDGRTVLSYWQQPGDRSTYGSGMCFGDDDGAERDCRQYNSDGTYATTHYDFTDKSKRNPLKALLRDPDGQPLMEADYE